MAPREDVRLRGVDRHGAGYRVRMRFGAAGRKGKTGLSIDEANMLALEWGRLKRQGLVPDDEPADLLLRDAAAGLLARVETMPKKSGLPRRAETIRWWKRRLKPWLEGPHAGTSAARMSRAKVEDWFYPRATEFPKTGNDELGGLKATLRFARGRGVKVDETIFEIAPLPYQVRPRHSLTVEQLTFFLQYFSQEVRPIIECCSTVGLRIGEALSLDVEQIDFETQTVSIPAAKNKERKDKTVDLTRQETRLLRVASERRRAPGVKAVFVTARGSRWIYKTFREDYWQPAVRAASAGWREAHGLSEEEETPFEWYIRDAEGEARRKAAGELVWDHLLIHDLRSTAATMMRDAGLTREQAAERIGHSDAGELLDRLYDQGDRRARSGVRRALDEVAPRGLYDAARSRLAKNAPVKSRGGHSKQ